MSPNDPAVLLTPSTGTAYGPPATPDPVHAATLDLVSTVDTHDLETKLLRSAGDLTAADGVSLWADHDGTLICYAAIGEGAERIAGMSIPVASIVRPVGEEDTSAVAVVSLARNAGALRVVRAGGPFSASDQAVLEHLAAAAGVALRNAERVAANDRTEDLSLVMEMSREIGSTLDLDRVMRLVVNLALRAVPFDRGAIALYERGKCDIRAVAGTETIDPEDPELQDLAVRGAWAAGVGQSFYLSDRIEPTTDAERTFAQIFAGDLAADGILSGLYIPLKDDEGVIGILVLESAHSDFATVRQQELATILAYQSTVALRNAQLYRQVPLADALGALQARKEAFFALPHRRRLIWTVVAAIVVASVTLIRWPLRVDGDAPVFRPTVRAEIRPLVDGIVERVFVREGATVLRGAPIVQLRDAESRAERDAVRAAASGADREATAAASRGDAAEEQLQRLRADVLRREVTVLDEQVGAALVRSPVSGIVLTSRPEDRIGAWVDAGAPVVLIGRTDTLDLEFGVDQRDIDRIHIGDEVRLRVDALPQRTFAARVTAIASIAADSAGAVRFPVRALVSNDSGFLRPGMVAYARVLTDKASLLGRAVREPARRIRLFWWRLWS